MGTDGYGIELTVAGGAVGVGLRARIFPREAESDLRDRLAAAAAGVTAARLDRTSNRPDLPWTDLQSRGGSDPGPDADTAVGLPPSP